MQSFNRRILDMPLSGGVDFGVDTDASATFTTWDGRGKLSLSPQEFAALFELLTMNKEMLEREIQELRMEKE